MTLVKLPVFICFCCFILATLENVNAASEERFLAQPLDHFNEFNEETWTMRYFVNEGLYQDGGPIFIYIGGDYQVGTYWLEHGHMFDIAVDLNGIVFGTETRFFGQNQPRNDTSTENLRFLSTDQILADTARLIDHIKQQDGRLSNAKVILVGQLYGGNIASWFRVKYPSYADGLWSSSSFVEARLNFAEYLEIVGDDLRVHGSLDCYRRIWRAFRTMENLINGGRSHLFDDMFGLCNSLDASNDLEVDRFFASIVEDVSLGIINGDYLYVHDMCQDITNINITNDLIAFSEWFLIEHRWQGCFQMNFQAQIDFLTGSDWNDFGVISGRRQYQYLTCTEYGWFATTDSNNQPFGSRIRLNYFIELCRRVFGEWITEEMLQENDETFNLNFGGNRPQITNAFFTNGGMDPHRAVNVLEDIGDSVEARTLPFYGHSIDLNSLSDDDSPTVRNAKIRVRELITQWVEN
ncbi:CLUMA_CG017466, isoform A [Clunio marinus]|uniref:CLUMA_CG017466, isoform A n=1 Tax=Clunio marinus TaxID=568069 RepID=A0A1J1IYY3_9DIPT|nr:CLUMA_CG017466, isoform A [Clunio marinus]